tara:strand:- start:453 stop:566 length:114 start_codon:yes stop_codon:yes gene_type:complete
MLSFDPIAFTILFISPKKEDNQKNSAGFQKKANIVLP